MLSASEIILRNESTITVLVDFYLENSKKLETSKSC